MKKLIGAAVVIVLLLGGGAGYLYFRLQEAIHSGEIAARIAKAIHEKTGRQASLGEIRFAWPLAVEVCDFKLESREGKEADLALDRLRVVPSLSPLLRGRVELRSVTLVRPRVRLVRLPDGRFNISDILEGSRETPGESPPAGPSASPGTSTGPGAGEGPSIPVPRLLVDDGILTYRDTTWAEEREIRAGGLDIELEPNSDGRAGTTRFLLTTQIAGARLHTRGTFRFTPAGLELEGKLDRTDLSPLARLVESEPLLPVDLIALPIAVTYRVAPGQDQDLLAGLTLSLSIDEAAVAPRGTPLPLEKISGRIQLEKGLLVLTDLTANLAGGVPIALAGTIENIPEAPVLDLSVEVRSADLSGLSGLAGGTMQEADASGTATGSLTLKGPISKPLIEGQLALRDVQLSLPIGGTRLPVTVAEANVKVFPNRAQTDIIKLKVGGNEVLVGGLVTDYLGEMSWRMDLDANDLDMTRVIADLPPDAQALLAPYGLGGHVTCEIQSGGSAKDIQYSGQILPKGLVCSLPAGDTSIPLEVKSGKIALQGQTLTSSDLVLSALGRPVTVSLQGQLKKAGPHIQVKATANTIPAEEVVPLVPAASRKTVEDMSPSGSFSVHVKVDVAPGEPPKIQADLLPAGLRAIVVSPSGLAIPVAIRSGKVTYAESRVSITPLAVALGQDGVLGTAILGGAAGPVPPPSPAQPEVPLDLTLSSDGLDLAGLMKLAGATQGASVSGNLALSSRLSGTPSALRMSGEASSSSIVLVFERKGGRQARVVLQDLKAPFQGTPTNIRCEPVTARLYGGPAVGMLEWDAEKGVRSGLTVKEVDLAPFLADTQGLGGGLAGRLDVNLQVITPDSSITTLSGKGQTVLRQLVVNGAVLRKEMGWPDPAKTASAVGALLGGGFGGGKVKEATQRLGSVVQGLPAKLSFLMSPHTFEQVIYSCDIERGRLVGEIRTAGNVPNKIGGNLTVSLIEGSAVGILGLSVSDGQKQARIQNITLNTDWKQWLRTPDFWKADVRFSGFEAEERSDPQSASDPLEDKKSKLEQKVEKGLDKLKELGRGLKGLFGGKKKRPVPALPPPANQ